MQVFMPAKKVDGGDVESIIAAAMSIYFIASLINGALL